MDITPPPPPAPKEHFRRLMRQARQYPSHFYVCFRSVVLAVDNLQFTIHKYQMTIISRFFTEKRTYVPPTNIYNTAVVDYIDYILPLRREFVFESGNDL